VWHWGFSTTRILMIDQSSVSPNTARRDPVDESLLRALLEHVEAHHLHFIAVTKPTSLMEKTESQGTPHRGHSQPNYDLMYYAGLLRKVGFRIGTGPCFAWSPSPTHPARQLLVLEDY
jgi:hypothetical protein